MGNFAAGKIYKSLAAGDPSFQGHVWKSAESAGSTLDCSAAENLLLGLWDPPDSAAMRSGLCLLVPQLPPPFLARGSCPQTPRVPARVHPPKAGRPLRAEQWLPQRSAPDPEELDSWGGVGRSATPCTPQALGARKANPAAGPAEPPWEQETERRRAGQSRDCKGAVTVLTVRRLRLVAPFGLPKVWPTPWLPQPDRAQMWGTHERSEQDPMEIVLPSLQVRGSKSFGFH